MIRSRELHPKLVSLVSIGLKRLRRLAVRIDRPDRSDMKILGCKSRQGQASEALPHNSLPMSMYSANFFGRRQRAGTALISAAILSTLSSLAVYTFVLIRPPVSQAAFPYVILPPLQVIATILITALLTRRPNKTGI